MRQRKGRLALSLLQALLAFLIVKIHSLQIPTTPLSSRTPFSKASRISLAVTIQTNMALVNEATRTCFQGKSVLLTGASGGLGAAIAKQLAICGVSELILTGRNEENLKEVQTQCLAFCPALKSHILLCDLSDRDSVSALAQKALQTCPNLDVLVNNGGVSSRSNFLDTALEVDEKIMQINFLAGAALAKALVPKMVSKNSGKVLWISSVQGKIGIPSRTSYAASKFAVQGYCESLRAELASSGVGVRKYSKRNLWSYKGF